METETEGGGGGGLNGLSNAVTGEDKILHIEDYWCHSVTVSQSVSEKNNCYSFGVLNRGGWLKLDESRSK